MASIKIHQDTFNFERRRLGFTSRQLVALAAAAGILSASLWVLMVPLGVSISVAPVLAVIPAVPAVIAGFAPIFGMPAEVFAQRVLDGSRRGPVIVRTSETVQQEEGELSRAYAKKKRKRGCERS